MSDAIGFYGKLPGYGDFIERNLPRPFIEQWDSWLQRAMQISQQMLGEHWLDCYLTAPIWRFALSSGCIDGSAWLGLMMPSVDRVGRYFPLLLAQPLAPGHSLACTLALNAAWFRQLEDIALACLNESPTVEAVVDVLQQLPAPAPYLWQRHTQVQGNPLAILASAETDMSASDNDMSPRQGLLLAEALLQQRAASFSLWYSQGTQENPSTLLSCDGMPAPQGFTALLSGQWQEYQWNVIR